MMIDGQMLCQLSGFIDTDKIHTDACPALVADVSAGEHGIIVLAFGKSYSLFKSLRMHTCIVVNLCYSFISYPHLILTVFSSSFFGELRLYTVIPAT